MISEINNAETMIDRAFELEPYISVAILQNKKPIAVLYKSDWESGHFEHIKAICRGYKPPEWFERCDYPCLGVSFHINLTEPFKEGK